MNPESHKLRHTHAPEVELHEVVSGEQAAAFGSVEEMLRHDREAHPVPDSVPRRLSASLAEEPKLETSWWRKIFSREA